MSSGQLLPNGRVLRYTMKERVIHWMAALSFIYLLLSGLAFFSPRLYWIAALLGGGPTARAWHPWAGLIFTVAIVWMFKFWHADMHMTDADRAWYRAVKNYVENRDQNLPPIGRFNPGQKQLFWLLFYSGIALLLSGLVLWFPEYIPWSMRWLREAAVLIHPIAALAAIGGFILHVYMGTAFVRGSFTTIVTGEAPKAWAKAHHRLWYSQITGQPAEKK